MKNNKKNTFLRLSGKKLNLFDVIVLYKLLPEFSYDDIPSIKLFLDNYYSIESMPDEFYNMFLYCVHSNRFKELFDILLKKNIYNLISFLKNHYELIGDFNDLITPEDYFKLSHKHIRTIVEFIKHLDLCNDEIFLKKNIASNTKWLLRRTGINSEDEFTKIAIKMYFSIGLDNTIDLLSSKYGLVDYDIIYYLFNNIDVISTSDENKGAFQEFLFNNKKDPTNNMRVMLAGGFNDLFINFDYFFNSINYFIDKLGTKLNTNKVSQLLKERYMAKKLERPELSGDILQDMLSSYYHKYGISDEETEIIDKNLNIYNQKLSTKTKSSILKTDIPKIGDYKIEMIPLSDARNLVMGYRAGNCFRINGDAFILFNKFLTSPHMRLLSISTDEYKDFGMVLLMRNGNVLMAQGIETSKRVPTELLGEKLYLAVKDAIECIMNKINEKDDEIVASIIGLSNNNTLLYNKNILSFIINPVLDDNYQFYNGIDSYQGLLSIKEGKTLNDIRLFIPNKLYNESNHEIFRRDSKFHDSYNYSEIEKILISLRYAKFRSAPIEEMVDYYKELLNKSEDYTVCTYDWFIRKFQDGSIDTFINSNAPEVIREYEFELNKIKTKRIDKS